MSEEPCESFEIAIEMRLHGELGPEEAAEVDAHLASCRSCREFEARARTLDRVLRRRTIDEEQAVDWTALRARVTGWRSQDLAALVVGAVLVLTASVIQWLDRFARSSSAAPGPPTLPVDLLFTAAPAAFLVWLAWSRRRDVLRATSPRYLTHFYRQDLAARIRFAHVMTWLAPLYLFSLFSTFTRLDFASRLLDVLFLALVAWERFVVLPRLEREEQDLPFFDDFPHLF